MADVQVDNKETPEVCVAEKDIEKVAPEVVDDDSADKSENGDKTENGAEEKLENGDTKDAENGDGDKEASADVCSNKRKSTAGGDGVDAPAEGVSPEKKAKLEEKSSEAESNGEAEVAA